MSSASVVDETNVSARSHRKHLSVRHPDRKPVIADVARFMPDSPQTFTRHEGLIKLMIMMAVAIGAIVAIASGKVFRHMTILPDGHHLSSMFWWITLLYGAMMYVVLAWRLILWRRYKPMPSVSDA
jgi:hypothetical protein